MTATPADRRAIVAASRSGQSISAIAETWGLPAATILGIIGDSTDVAEDAAAEAVRSVLEPFPSAARVRILTAAGRVRCGRCGKPTGDTPGAWTDVCTCEEETK